MNPRRWAWRRRCLEPTALVAAAVGLSLVGPPMLGTARAAGLTPKAAEAKRAEIREAVAEDIESGHFAVAADTMAEEAEELGDPVSFVEAGDLHLRQAEADRNIAQCEAAIEVTTIGLDILHFYAAVAKYKAKSQHLVIKPADAAELIDAANDQIKRAEALIEEIEAEVAAAAAAAAGPAEPPPPPAKDKPGLSPGTGLVIGGAAATAVGIGGVSMVIAGVLISNGKQQEVEDLARPADESEVTRIDDEGKRGNVIAIAGAALGAVGLAVGVPLLFLGAKKRKEGASGTAASLRLAPAMSRTGSGLVLSGRF